MPLPGRSLPLRLLGLVAGGLLAAAPLAGLAAGPAVAATPTLVQTRNVLPGLHADGVTRTGDADPAGQLHIAVTLAHPDPAAEDQAVAALYDRASPGYHHFLSPQQIADQFGVDAAIWQRTLDWAHSAGLTVDQQGVARDFLSANGTVAQLSSLLHTTFGAYTEKGHAFVANDVAPSVPGDLPITGVTGLNTLQGFHTLQDTCLNGTCTGLTRPQDLWSTYDMPDTQRGAGQQVAVFGEGRFDDVTADLHGHETKFGLPQVPVDGRHIGTPPPGTDFSDDSGLVEWNIDTQASGGMAPDIAKEVLYFGYDLSDANVLDVFNAWNADANGPKQANASYGECEENPTNPVTGQLPATPAGGVGLGDNVEAAGDQILKQAVLQGKTLFSSTGDTGSSCPVVFAAIIGAGNGVANQGVPLLNYPAASPYAVAAGGTVLYTDAPNPPDLTAPSTAQRVQEYAWNFTGGGTSSFITGPAYQADTPNLVGVCVATPEGQPTNTGQRCRGVPDVAAQSGDVLTNGYSIITNDASGAQSATAGGGTSLSSPLLAGMWARIQGAQPVAGGNGFANYTFYRAGKSDRRAADYFDVTTGDNGLYSALPNWDYVSGWGVPDVANLITDVQALGPATPPSDVPEAPYAVLLPVGALAAAGALLMVRRRRTA